MSSLLQVIKKAAIDAVRASNPVALAVGSVVSVSPLKISLSQQLTLTEQFLIIPQSLTDYKTKIEFTEKTKGANIELNEVNYNGSITLNATTHEVTIYNGLKAGDKVILLKMQGGQKYLVIDKVVV